MTNLGNAAPKRETAKALLVWLESDGEEHWIPKSVIRDESECYSMKSGDGDLIVEDWFAEKEGLA
jgi:hypothetical protein